MQFFLAIFVHSRLKSMCVCVINIMVNAVCVCLATPESRSCCAFASTHILWIFFFTLYLVLSLLFLLRMLLL